MIRVPSGLNWENATYVSHRNGLKMGVPPQRARRLSRATSTAHKWTTDPADSLPAALDCAVVVEIRAIVRALLVIVAVVGSTAD